LLFTAEAKPKEDSLRQKLIVVFEKLYEQASTLTPETLSRLPVPPSTSTLRQLEEDMNSLSDRLLIPEEAISGLLDSIGRVYEVQADLFGKSDPGIRQINKLLREAVAESTDY